MERDLSMADKKDCFVVSPIGRQDTEVREHADQTLTHIIKPVFNSKNYTVVRADEIDNSGVISTQIVQRLISADIVVADLSYGNPNVYYELALRHAIRKPFIHMSKDVDSISFDISHNRTIIFNRTNLDSVAKAKDKLSRQIDEIETGDAELENPIATGIDLQILRTSENVDSINFAKILEEIADLRKEIRFLRADQEKREQLAKMRSERDHVFRNLVSHDNKYIGSPAVSEAAIEAVKKFLELQTKNIEDQKDDSEKN